MLEPLQMFLFLFKSKYRRRRFWGQSLAQSLGQSAGLLLLLCLLLGASACNDTTSCSENGVCKNGTCICYDGWQGPQCQFCGGKVRLGAASGVIHDGLGNYSVGVKCSWLLDAPNSSITLHLEEFATECGWDHLYVYDGDSVNSPLLAVFSGLMYKDSYRIRRIPEVVAHSGAALLHFFSDDAYNMSGFNLTYRLNACPSQVSGRDCSGNGVCIEGTCTCDALWDGAACHLRKCPGDCGAAERRGRCDLERHGCVCSPGYQGEDCAQLADLGHWQAMRHAGGFVPPGSASHGAAVWKDSLYIVGGESYSQGHLVYTYDFNGNVWETPHMEGSASPTRRYGHSTVLYGDKIFMYGGVVGNQGPCSELWAFDISAKVWENITVRSAACHQHQQQQPTAACGPLKTAGHTATVVTGSSQKSDRMVVIFGHSPNFGYLNTVQEYYFGTREWHLVRAGGYPVKGGYGHSSCLDPLTGRIYVYGGIISERESAQVLSSALYAYQPDAQVWTALAAAPSARFLHTAAFVSPGLMLVFGGNTHSDNAHSFGAKCYSADLLAYDAVCDAWTRLEAPQYLGADLARFGHSAVLFEGSLFVYGGFDGQMLSDMLRYTPGRCGYFQSQRSCLAHRPGVLCAWHRNACIPAVEVLKGRPLADLQLDLEGFLCPELNRSAKSQRAEQCRRLNDCPSCGHTSHECVWCDNACLHRRCKASFNESAAGAAVADQCSDPAPYCAQLHTCPACHWQPHCRWDVAGATTKCSHHHHHHYQQLQQQQQQQVVPANVSAEAEGPTCAKVCSEFTSCYNCTTEECIWCQNEGRCVDKNAYTASFPYGQCREWTTSQTKCKVKDADELSQCSFYASCAQCRDDPACGWCDDGSQTGLGQCLAGGNMGPTLHEHSLPSNTCLPGRWHFTTCPLCQCNGHASCGNNSSACQACRNMTTGQHCERCRPGFHGTPVNGGTCRPCQCNGQATHCQPETGKCYCTTKGLAGDNCEKCDATNHYHSDPLNKGSCYYDLTIDYQFTFNLSKKEDSHFTQINFRNSPTKPDIDADFSIYCSKPARMNITIKRANGEEKLVLANHNCSSNYKSRFAKTEYNFGVEKNVTQTTFYVHVFDMHPPLWIQISFSQYPKLNLQQFFITFSTCFLLLLLAAAVLWKIKQRYDLYRRRQRMFVEMEQMASRPFSQVLVELEERDSLQLLLEENNSSGAPGPITAAAAKRRKKDVPSPIALEPCCGNRAAVLSLLVRLPTGGEAFTPRGQSAGLAVASALVTLGNPRKLSIDQCNKTAGTEGKMGKGRSKAQSQHPDSC